MTIEHEEVPVRDIVADYKNNKEDGVFGLYGRLNIRPKYQREFIYKKEQKEAVISTIFNGFPLNVMYWADNDDGTYELLDGQQRTLSICEYVNGGFAVDFKFFHNLDDTEKELLLNYKLNIYICKGNSKDKLSWFKVINTAGEKLTEQELRNAVYTGDWLTSAKDYFSKTECPAYSIASKYLRGSPIRQEYLETVLSWVSKGNIEHYMAQNQKTDNANKMWLYFSNVINWVKTTFPVYRPEQKGLDFSYIYDLYKDKDIDPKKIEKEVSDLMQDDDVTKKSGIYYYVLTREEKHLNIRTFSVKQKREAYEKQKGICPICGHFFDIDDMEADHITPWSKGGKTELDNCQLLCRKDNRQKSNKY